MIDLCVDARRDGRKGDSSAILRNGLAASGSLSVAALVASRLGLFPQSRHLVHSRRYLVRPVRMRVRATGRTAPYHPLGGRTRPRSSESVA
jgi:hypothetical protein